MGSKSWVDDLHTLRTRWLNRIGGFTDAFSNNHGSSKNDRKRPLLEAKLVLQSFFFHFHDDGRKSIRFKWNHKWFAQFHPDHFDDFDAWLELKSNGGNMKISVWYQWHFPNQPISTWSSGLDQPKLRRRWWLQDHQSSRRHLAYGPQGICGTMALI